MLFLYCVSEFHELSLLTLCFLVFCFVILIVGDKKSFTLYRLCFQVEMNCCLKLLEALVAFASMLILISLCTTYVRWMFGLRRYCRSRSACIATCMIVVIGSKGVSGIVVAKML